MFKKTDRKLYVVPIIHTQADLGTLATAIDKAGRDRLGEDFWQEHKTTVTCFWDSVASFIDSLTVAGFKLYQDGLIADGEMGMRIVEQGVKDGSKNYEIIAQLLQRGAELVMTEDLNLVKREYNLLSEVVKAKSSAAMVTASAKFKLAARELLDSRDAFIANRVAQTLGTGETGILLIGAYHNIVPRLLSDIAIKEVKKIDKVRKYQMILVDFKRSKAQFEQLRDYLIAPVTLDWSDETGS